jgi:hypothetical protein
MATPPEQFIMAVNCHWCGNIGSSLWETLPTGRQLMSLEGFYERVAKKQPFDIERVCNTCGKVQPV